MAASSQQFAIKFLSADWKHNQRIIESFRHEARLLSTLNHPHILPVVDTGCWNSYEYMVLPFVSGFTGDDLFSEIAPVSDFEIVGYLARQLFSTVAYIHEFELGGQPLHILHRDISPLNLLFSKEGHMYLIDFGSAKSELFNRSVFDGRQVAVSATGIDAYVAPEQRNIDHVENTHLSDIYAAGLVVYRLLVPFLHLADSQIGKRELHPLPIVSDAIRQFFDKVLAENPTDRYSSAADALQAIEEAFPTVTSEEFQAYIRMMN